MIKYLLFLLLLFTPPSYADPSLDETIKFMSNIASSNNNLYYTDISLNGCVITYTNHPKYNLISKDDSQIGRSCTANNTPWTDGIASDNPIKSTIDKTVEDTKDVVKDATHEVSKGFFNYFLDNKDEEKSQEDDRVKKFGENNIFMIKADLSKLNPEKIKEKPHGFLVKSTNNEKNITISFYKEECNTESDQTYHFNGINELLIFGESIDSDAIYFYVDNEDKQKFKDALEHSINLCGGKKDLF